MLNRPLLVVTIVGASAIMAVTLASFGAPYQGAFNQYYSGRSGGSGWWQLPPQASLTPLSASPQPVVSASPAPTESADDDGSWFARLRQSIASFWQRLF